MKTEEQIDEVLNVIWANLYDRGLQKKALKQLIEDAYFEGYNAGSSAGYEEGYDDGCRSGYDSGYDDGVSKV